VIDHKTLGPLEPVFTFVGNDGSNVNIHSGRLREAVLRSKLKVTLVPIDLEIAHSYVKENCVRIDRVKELAKRKNLDPIIYCEDGFTDGIPDVMLVDGHHRYVMAALLQHLPVIPAVICLKEFWKPFQIIGLEDVSADLLRAIPVLKRYY
jgi:hypothetical protein